MELDWTVAEFLKCCGRSLTDGQEIVLKVYVCMQGVYVCVCVCEMSVCLYVGCVCEKERKWKEKILNQGKLE